MRPYILLTPGPLTTTDSVKQAMLADWCTWDEDYNVHIVEEIRQALVRLATTATDEYTSVLMQGSGTYCVESVIGSAIKPGDKLLILSNGAYGDRMGHIAEYHGIAYDMLSFDETEQVSTEYVDDYLSHNAEITHVAIVHCETTTGILNPLEQVAHIVKMHGKRLIVDAMSSFGGIPLDVHRLGIDFLISSSNKCIQGVPGFGFIIARRSELTRCKGVSRSLSLDIYDQWETMEKGHGKWRFTSPTHVVRAFKQALEELQAEGGIEARHRRYCANHDTLVEGMRSLGFRTLLPDEVQSPVITSFYYPHAGFDFKDFYAQLKSRGFVIYPGKISQADTFRIGNIGDVHPDDFRRLIESIRECKYCPPYSDKQTNQPLPPFHRRRGLSQAHLRPLGSPPLPAGKHTFARPGEHLRPDRRHRGENGAHPPARAASSRQASATAPDGLPFLTSKHILSPRCPTAVHGFFLILRLFIFTPLTGNTFLNPYAMTSKNAIIIKGARVNNLKNIDVEIPRDKLIVVTGLSGSGKSSLAFDTLYAEGQRRYVESLSSYARQFLGRMSKPECDYIKGIPPAIAIEQKVSSRNPRSTVGTSTEVYDYLRLLYARVGHTYSPVSGQEVKKHSAEDVVQCVAALPEGTRFTVLTPLVLREGRTLAEQLGISLKEGFTRIEVNGQPRRIEDYCPEEGDTVFLMVDRLTASPQPDARSRLTDSVETAMYEGDGACLLRVYQPDGSTSLLRFSNRFEADGICFQEPTDQTFSFNSPIGACPVCEGFGRVIGIDEHLVVPNRSLSVYDGAVVCWRGEKMGQWKDMVVRGAERAGFPIFTPYYQLTDEQRRMLWEGTPYFEGIDAFFRMLQENQYKIQYRVMLARYRGKTVCPACHGTRLKKEATYVKVGGRNICELVDMPIDDLRQFFATLSLPPHDAEVARRLLAEINNRLAFLTDVGLGYLTLNRLSNSLSGGESQRINLATSLGSSLVGSLYILDEPSIGLHSRDTGRLIHVLRQLQQAGNTVVVVEHDEEIIRAADYIIDIGPRAGRLGGEIVYQGDMHDLRTGSPSYTVRYLLGEDTIPVPQRRPWNNYIEIIGARENNLKGIDVRFPLNVMTVVTGVSGSGKSTLVRDILYRALKRELDECVERPGEYVSLGGDVTSLRAVEFVDQNPIGKSSRSNPATYLKAYDDIRKLYAEQPLAKQMGYGPGYFSFNSEGGRCEECKGEGTVTVEMQFMADLVLECEACHGKRFKKEVLDVTFHGQSIYDVLEMTVDQAIDFFASNSQKKIARRLQPLQDVGLGYIKLGQSSSSLSGGENQRVKLAYYLSLEKTDPTLFIFDEPTTGLHFHDIRRLLQSFDALIRRGHSIVIIEHNLDVVKCADHIIDLGPEGGEQGGNVVAVGTPEEVARCAESYTGHYLREKLGMPEEVPAK